MSPECFCGAAIHYVNLPEDMGGGKLWLHTGTKDIYCYEGYTDCRAEPFSYGPEADFL